MKIWSNIQVIGNCNIVIFSSEATLFIYQAAIIDRRVDYENKSSSLEITWSSVCLLNIERP